MIVSERLILFLSASLLIMSCSSEKRQNMIYEEIDGVVAIEAEHYSKQSLDEVRKWYLVSSKHQPVINPDPDPFNFLSASGGAYLEVLPDSRTNHDEELIVGENFINEPGKMAVLEYKVYFENPGKYYVWVRTNTSGTEDNGLHVGLDGEWPATGQRMQFDGNRKVWSWESRQRTEEVHTGVPKLIYLEIVEPGLHTISFSMREDGFEFDKWVMKKQYIQPENSGPEERIYK